MIENGTNGDNETPFKKQKTDTNTPYQSKVDYPKIFILNIDCFDEIFDYLPAEALLSLGQTCRIMNQVIGGYVKESYSSAVKLETSDIVHRLSSINRTESAESSCFNQFIRYISLKGVLTFRYIESNATTFTSVSHLYLEDIDLTPRRLNCIHNILNTLEVVEIKNCPLNCNFYETFLRNCVNLKRLYISSVNEDIIQASQNDWLLKKYPKFEHLGLIPQKQLRFNMNDLHRFFELNPQVKSLSTNYRFLWERKSSGNH